MDANRPRRSGTVTTRRRSGWEAASPPALGRALDDEERLGKQLFESPATQCTQCHVPSSEYTNGVPAELTKRAPPPGFEDEEDGKFKTPSLLFVGGTSPHYHDGSEPTLASLVARHGDRMGKTAGTRATTGGASSPALGCSSTSRGRWARPTRRSPTTEAASGPRPTRRGRQASAPRNA